MIKYSQFIEGWFNKKNKLEENPIVYPEPLKDYISGEVEDEFIRLKEVFNCPIRVCYLGNERRPSVNTSRIPGKPYTEYIKEEGQYYVIVYNFDVKNKEQKKELENIRYRLENLSNIKLKTKYDIKEDDFPSSDLGRRLRPSSGKLVGFHIFKPTTKQLLYTT